MARLDALLRAAQQEGTQVPPHLMSAVIEDARRLQPVQVRDVRATRWRFPDIFGGWRAMGGLVAATCAGFWIGISPPAMVQDAEALFFGATNADYIDDTIGFGWTTEEG